MKATTICAACKKSFEQELVPLVPGVPEDGYYRGYEVCPECDDEAAGDYDTFEGGER